MFKKLIIFILFLVITVVAIGFVSIPGFKFATQVKLGDEAGPDLDNATAATVIEVPIAPAFINGCDRLQLVISFDESGIGYIQKVADTKQEDGTYAKAYDVETLSKKGFNYISGPAVLIWLFMLVMIILLPRKHGKKKIKKLAKEVAEDVVDEEMDNMMPPQRYAPAPAARGPRGAEGRRRHADYDEDYDY